MKSIPNLDYSKLITGQKKPIGKYGNLKNFLKERDGIDIDDNTLDKKLRTFFEDLITEILKNPSRWDRTKNINFMELFNYLSGIEEQELPPQQPEQIEQTGEQENRDNLERAKNHVLDGIKRSIRFGGKIKPGTNIFDILDMKRIAGIFALTYDEGDKLFKYGQEELDKLTK